MERPNVEILKQEHVRESNWSKATRGIDPERDALIDKITKRPPRPLSRSKAESEVKSEDGSKENNIAA